LRKARVVVPVVEIKHGALFLSQVRSELRMLCWQQLSAANGMA
jgi:hypothetical protein